MGFGLKKKKEKGEAAPGQTVQMDQERWDEHIKDTFAIDMSEPHMIYAVSDMMKE
ncbi:hypothetical protein QJS10_CPB15g00740 [Acorus calamus]|uniref:Uncharacterized protein n=1 Tax=Acorus calamus TaxID=4465 RepID=A0AAV9D5L7_ACOCL|nr:hypothetical protein QJS10_CPB15g00740 [Acorus calamus]